MTEDSNKLARKTVKGVAWNYTAFASSKLVTFIVSIILARILAPEDFGLLALGLLAVNYLEIINQFGISAAVIYRQEDPERTAHVAFSLSLLTGITLTVLGYLSAPLIANFFNEPRLIEIVRVLAVTFMFSTFAGIPEALLQKELKFRKRFIPQVGRTIGKGIVSISMALLGFGVWSLVWGQVAGTAVAAVMFYVVTGWRPKLVFDMEIARSLMGYGVQMVSADFLGVLHRNIDYVIIGRRMASAQLGFYTVAFRLPELIIISICSVIGQTMFPTYAKLQDDPEAMRKGFLLMLRYVSMITIPAATGLFLVAPEFINVFYTERWAPAIPIMQVLTLYAMALSLSFNVGAVYKATGRPDILNKIAILKLALTVPVLWIAAGYSIFWVAIGQFVTTAILTVVRLTIAKNIVDVPYSQVMNSFRPALISSALMAVAIVGVGTLLADVSLSVRLVVFILTGMLTYPVAIWFTGRDSALQVIEFMKPIVSKYLPANLKSAA